MMRKAFVFSVLFHLLILLLILFVNIPESTASAVTQQLKIRIAGSAFHSSVANFMPDVQNLSRETENRPLIPNSRAREMTFSTEIPSQKAPNNLPLIPLPPVKKNAELNAISPESTLPALDPLAGMENHLSSLDESAINPDWSISWEKGHERRLVSMPQFDESIIGSISDRLSNVSIRIEVSPEGFVVAAEIQAPGSGDVNIDRYIHGKALDFIFDRVLDEKGVDAAVFKIVFGEWQQ